MLSVSILGATGYTGGELLRLLSRHPRTRLAHATTTSKPGVALAEAHPDLRGVVSGVLEPFDAPTVAAESDVVFSCLPHTESQKAVVPLLKANPKVKVIDLSGDFRFKSAADYQAAYGVPHLGPQYLSQAAYGIPELFRPEIRRARIVANPGCYPTSTLIPLAPLAKAGLLAGDVIVDAKSGVSGAGATPTPDTHFPEANESVKAYKPLIHRHQPEMVEQLTRVAGRLVPIHFVPHLVPLNRGILATIYCTLSKPQTPTKIHALLTDAYPKEPFVRILPQGALPEVRNTTGTNFVDIGFALNGPGNFLVLVAALDNLTKGAAGQAVQNLNVMAGEPETAGLLSRLSTKDQEVIA